MDHINKFKIKIFADGADKDSMLEMAKEKHIAGLTTNPTLMRKAGISNYEGFAKEVLEEVKDKSISFEVFSDDLLEMERQAEKIASWGDNVFVKIPVTNTRRISCKPLIKNLSANGVKVNVTAVMTLQQVDEVIEALDQNTPSYLSVFAGRIADTGVDPIKIMAETVEKLKQNTNCELIWASPRELLNIVQADQIGCHIITVTNDILNKLKMVDYSLDEYSLDTVKMFYNDAKAAGYSL